jgi:hypothetical protein
MTSRARRVVAAVSLAAALCASAGVSAPAQARDRFAVGDSVMLGARQALRSAGFRVDAEESRQATAGRRVLRGMGARLAVNVVVHLGTNGTFPLASCKAMVRQAGAGRRVFFVTVLAPRSWERANNAVIRRCDADFAADRVHVVDWARAAALHPHWLYADGIHLRPRGAEAFARLIDQAVDAAIAAAPEVPHGAA